MLISVRFKSRGGKWWRLDQLCTRVDFEDHPDYMGWFCQVMDQQILRQFGFVPYEREWEGMFWPSTM